MSDSNVDLTSDSTKSQRSRSRSNVGGSTATSRGQAKTVAYLLLQTLMQNSAVDFPPQACHRMQTTQTHMRQHYCRLVLPINGSFCCSFFPFCSLNSQPKRNTVFVSSLCCSPFSIPFLPVSTTRFSRNYDPTHTRTAVLFVPRYGCSMLGFG